MNFDYIEGLTEEQVKELYDEIELGSNDKISKIVTVYETKCSNGYTSYAAFLVSYYVPVGSQGYGVEYSVSVDFGSISSVCGKGVYGYSRVILSEEKNGIVYETKCNDGYVSYSAFLVYMPLGYSDYRAEYSVTASLGSISKVCGIGRAGYSRVVEVF